MTRPLRTLVVDDHAVNLRYLEVLLRRDGHTVRCVSDGQQAVDAARAEVFDLVLMDLHMPVMDGETAIRHIRALPAPHSGAVIIVATADGADTARERVQAAGANDFLEKPIDARDLRQTIDRSTSNPAATGPASTSAATDAPPVDAERLAELRELIPEDTLRDMWTEVIESPDTGLRALLLALEHGDPGPAATAAHRFKSSCMMMGLTALQQAAAEAEATLRGATPPSPQAMQAWCEPLRQKATITLAALQQG